MVVKVVTNIEKDEDEATPFKIEIVWKHTGGKYYLYEFSLFSPSFLLCFGPKEQIFYSTNDMKKSLLCLLLSTQFSINLLNHLKIIIERSKHHSPI